jgi:hypothetical protein
MSRSLRRFSALSFVALAAILASPVGSAQASNASIQSLLGQYTNRLLNDEQGVLTAEGNYNPSSPKPLINSLTRVVNDFHMVQTKLEHQSASTVQGRQGKDDIAAGMGEIARSYAALASAFKAESASMPIPITQVMNAVTLAKEGGKKIDAGVRLLS